LVERRNNERPTLNLEPGTLSFGCRRRLAACAIAVAVLAAYRHSLSSPFIFDDEAAILNNPTIRQWGSAWRPVHDISGVSGRPVINFSLAVNYALGGLDVRGYHAVNLAIHILCGLTLFGIVRRTLLSACRRGALTPQSTQMRDEGIPPTPPASATMLAFVIALLWAVHPLQTESVTCVVQRTESLMGLFYLLTLYCYIRGADERRQASGVRVAESEIGKRRIEGKDHQPWIGSINVATARVLTPGSWLLLSIVSCLLGMASKEVMVSAPLMVWLYDRTFIAGSFREAWKQRGRWLAGLACTWLVLGYLVLAGGGSRGRAAGFGLGVTSWNYALTQCWAVIHYLKLSVWPRPLILDYGTKVVPNLTSVLPQAIMLALLALATVVALCRRPRLGFAGAWFFAILAPSSSVVPLVAQTVAEHRMYLPLASVVTVLVLALYRWLGRNSLAVFLAAAVGCGYMTAQRNNDYKTDLSIWTDTVAKCPGNERAHNNLGNVFLKLPGGLPGAIDQFETAVRLAPDSPKPHNNLGNALCHVPGRLADAIAECETALHLQPDYAEAHNNLGNALALEPGRLPDAIAQYDAALRIEPGYAEAHYNLGNAFFQSGRFADAMGEYETAVRLKPDYAEAHNNLGNALAELDRLPEAIGQYELALRCNPDYVNARKDLEQVRNALVQETAGQRK
jgi:tetratricopeptide (TPR) repeat protein